MALADDATRAASRDAAAFVREVERVFHQYWGGHYEVVETFFGQPRPREQLVAWLELQLYKEIHVVPGKVRELLAMYEQLDEGVERGELEAEAYELADEIQHYRLLADILELLTGQRRPALSYRPTPPQTALEDVRRKYAGSSPLVRAVGGFGPGGGTAFAAAGSLIDGGPVERLLAEAFKVIYAQERQHYHKNHVLFDRQARAADPREYTEALRYAHELARQHFLLRNDSFGSPLSVERVAQIDAGEVVPYAPPRLY